MDQNIRSLSFMITRCLIKRWFLFLKAHASRLAGFIYKKLEDSVLKKNTDFNVTSAWDSFSNWACKLNNDDCVTNALKYFKKWQTGEKLVCTNFK